MTSAFNVHSRVFGEGPRRALAIHCSLGHSGAWRGVGAALSDLVTLTAFDLPGHGRSDAWDGEQDLSRLSRDLALPFMRDPVDMVGHSFGATVALRLAVEHPALVRSLTLIEPVFFAATKDHSPEDFTARCAEVSGYEAALERDNLEAAAHQFHDAWGTGTAWESLPAAMQQHMAAGMHLIQGQSPAILHDNASLLRPGRLERADMPCLLLRGGNSPAIIEAIQNALAARLPLCTEVVVSGAGHMVPITHPEAVATAIRAHLEVA